MLDILAIGQAAAVAIGPFLPYLGLLKKSAEKKLETAIEEQGGEFLWKQAQGVWGKLAEWWTDDEELISIAKLVATAPDKPERQEQLGQAIAERLEKDEGKASEVQKLLGGPAGVQELIAGHHAKIRNFHQKAKAGAHQRIQVGDSADISDSVQSQD